jgi:hypothetical protein
MPAFKATVALELDGVPLAGSPWVRRYELPELSQVSQEQADDGDATTFNAVQAAHLDTLRVVFLVPDRQATFRFDGQTDGGLTMDAGGLVLLLGATIDAGAGADNASVNNNSGGTVTLRGLLVGT